MSGQGAEAWGRILVVDDEAMLRQLLVEAVREYGFMAQAAAGADAALAALAEHPFDVILSDLNMPGKSGLALLVAMRAAGHRQPFIILSGGCSGEDRDTALRLSAAAVLEKPLDIRSLVQELHRHAPR